MAEQENGIIIQAARSMLMMKLSVHLWAEACNTAIYLLKEQALLQLLVNNHETCGIRKTDRIAHFEDFGPDCYVHIPKQQRIKWDAKSIPRNICRIST